MKRFWSKVHKGLHCWEWQAAKRDDGYGCIKIAGKSVQAHRQSYTLTNGPIPDGMLVLHKCDNRMCCNPDHLFLGTHQDNTDDMIAKGRHPHKETNGKSKLTQAIVDEARQLYAAGGVTLTTLAQKYGVTRQAIGDAVKGRSWS